MSTKLDARQTISRDLLDQLVNATGTELDDILRALNEEATPPLRMSASSPADQILTIDSISVANPATGRNRTIPTISNTLPAFASGTVTVPTSSGGTVTVSPGTNSTLTLSVGNYIKMGVSLDASGNLSVQFGVEGASVAAATAPPAVNNTFAIGYVVLQNVAGTISTVTDANIYQYVGGGGGGGSGDANSFLETLKNQLNDSTYEFLTPNIFSQQEDSLIDGASTATYSLVTQAVSFSAGAETLVSAQMLDADFLDESKDVGSVELSAQWLTGSVDTAAAYEVSRDGGNEYQAVTMARIGASDTFTGKHVFDTEAADQSIVSQATQDGLEELNVTTNRRMAQVFTLSSATVVKEVELDIEFGGTPVGNMYVSIVADDSTLPSTDLADLFCESQAIDVSGLATGLLAVTMPTTVLPAGTYHLVIRTDETYKTEYTNSAGGSSIGIDSHTTVEGKSKYDGATWTDDGTIGLKFDLKGRDLDLRVRVTSSTGPVELSGYGVLYDLQTEGISTGTKNRQVFKFNATDNPNEFTLTQFLPDPDLLEVFLAETGQVFRTPAFSLDGKKVVFPVDTFDNGGVPQDFTLIFESLKGSSFDNSDENALLMSGNFLGSTDAQIDRSVAGRGIFLRKPNGTLREIAIDDSDNIVIFSV